ncbi:hypothetical protein JYT72_00505 [Crocinitomix catalasitica]|nr:hypothetical protein [Crocinitomix catalasitica]
MHWLPYIGRIPGLVMIFLVLAVVAIKKGVSKENPKIKDPLIHSQPTRAIFLCSIGILMIALMLRFMDWLGFTALILTAMTANFVALLFSLIRPEGIITKESDEILDDIR